MGRGQVVVSSPSLVEGMLTVAPVAVLAVVLLVIIARWKPQRTFDHWNR